MNTYKNKKLKIFLIFSSLISYSFIFSSTQNCNAFMKFFQRMRGSFNMNSSGNSKSYGIIAGNLSLEGKFTPIIPSDPLYAKHLSPKLNANIFNEKKSNKSTLNLITKLETKIETSKSIIDLNKGYKEILENGIRNAKNPKVKEILYLDLMSTSLSIGNLEYKHQKLQTQLNKIKNNN